MKTIERHYLTNFVLITVLSLCAFIVTSNGAPLGTAFTYQGQLQNGVEPVNGLYDFEFTLSNAVNGGAQLGSTLTQTGVAVNNGFFSTTLDFGSLFGGEASWLTINVRSNATGSYVQLTPAEMLTPAPNAIFANSASNVANLVSGP